MQFNFEFNAAKLPHHEIQFINETIHHGHVFGKKSQQRTHRAKHIIGAHYIPQDK